MPYSKCPPAVPLGISRVIPPLGGITPLTCTIFDPTFCGRFHSFNFAQICVLDSYRPKLSLFLLTTSQIATNTPTGAIQQPAVTFQNVLQFQKRKRYNTYLYCIFFLLNISPTFPAFEPHSRIIFLLLITWCKIGVVFLD